MYAGMQSCFLKLDSWSCDLSIATLDISLFLSSLTYYLVEPVTFNKTMLELKDRDEPPVNLQ